MPPPGHQYANIQDPFATTSPHITQFTIDQIQELQVKLDRQLGPEFIQSRQGNGGGSVKYLAGEKAINLANEVFGFNGWSSSIQNVNVDFVDVTSEGRVSLGCTIICRVTLKDGSFHEDIGFGESKNNPSKGAAFQKAKKEAATDAMKRALRNFGNVLGNCLYDKDYLSKVSKMKAEPKVWDPEKLHRHSSLVPQPPKPMKQHASVPVQAEVVVPIKTPVTRKQSVQSLRCEDEFEDEYGVDVFDELDSDLGDIDYSGENAQVNLNHSAPGATANIKHSIVSNNGVGAPRSINQPTANGTISTNGHNKPVTVQSPQIQQRQQQMPSKPILAAQPQPASTSNGLSNAATSLVNPVDNNIEGQPSNEQPMEPPKHMTGFVSLRTISRTSEDGIVAPNESVKPFNPHTAPGTIPRTHGVDHSKSAKILRAVQDVTSMPAVVTPHKNLQQRSNFINPQADTGRRIGMPGNGVPSPHNNRSAYKPPGPALKRHSENASRPALTDVSNTHSAQAGEQGVKKIRLDNSGDSNSTTSTIKD